MEDEQTILVQSMLPPSAPMPERALLSGTLAASMERIARLAASALSAPGALVSLLGNDRRSFRAGTLSLPWFAHDSGALVRSGLLEWVMAEGGHACVQDARIQGLPMLHSQAGELQLVSLAASSLGSMPGSSLGALCVFDEVAREWSETEMSILSELSAMAATELQLRRALAEREMRERQLQHDSLHDPLTGLPNRSLFMKRLADATLRARRDNDGMFAVVFLDLDDFKLVNDSMGHHVGDEVLVSVARRLEDCVRGGDIVARLGGDEFAILLERVADARDTALVAERVQSALTVPMNIGGYEHVCTASIGVALSTSANERPEYLLRSADMAMYRAKNSGRARYELFDRAMHADALTRLQVENDLRRAIEREEFELHYQPIISLRTGKIVAVEALIRWQHRERGLVAPGEFVPVAEDTGLIVPMGRWAMRTACRQVREWQLAIPRREGLSLSVNLSVREFSQNDLVRRVAEILEESGLPAGMLRLEITESVIIEQANPALQTIAELRTLGVEIHLDDFGTGYSSLSYLHRLPLDAIKIDRDFISALDEEERPRHVVRAIVDLARAVGLPTIAEGVTRPRQAELLLEMGCEFAQGFFYAKPLIADEMENLLRQEA